MPDAASVSKKAKGFPTKSEIEIGFESLKRLSVQTNEETNKDVAINYLKNDSSEMSVSKSIADVAASAEITRSSHDDSYQHLSRSSSPNPTKAKASPLQFESSSWMNRLSWENTGAILFPFWFAGLLAVLVHLAWNYWNLVRAISQCREARPQWASELQRLGLELGLNHNVRLQVHSKLGPFLCWTPSGTRVVVPVRLWNRLRAEERIAVLHHELCHLRRGDLWKSALARFVVAAHWFNPLAWLSARRFDESAEWSCDAMLAREAPARTTLLAKALLTAAQTNNKSHSLALSATGGPLFQRVRRLLAWNTREDSVMWKGFWVCSLIVLLGIACVRVQFVSQIAQAADTTLIASSAASDLDIDESELKEIAERIVTAEDKRLVAFVKILQSSSGQIAMADRSARAVQSVIENTDMASLWNGFVEKRFVKQNERWVVKPDQAELIKAFIESVNETVQELDPISKVFKEVSSKLDQKSETSSVLARFLSHEAAPSLIYRDELRERLHPSIEDMANQFQNTLVRSASGRYLIRLARKPIVERKLALVNRLQEPLARFEKELTAWADDLDKGDRMHVDFAEKLARPEFAKFLILDYVTDEMRFQESELENVFGKLEEATDETAAGLKLNPESQPFKELKESMDRFSLIWENRDALQEPLTHFADQIVGQDELHLQLKTYCKTEFAFLMLAREMNYLPIQADAAARDWLSQIVTKSDSGKYEVTYPSEEELKNRIEGWFQDFREVRRRGRIVDEFAISLAEPAVQSAMKTLTGKLLLVKLVEDAAERPDVNGLQLWFDEHFEERSEGLVLREGAELAIDEFLAEVAGMESELAKVDF